VAGGYRWTAVNRTATGSSLLTISLAQAQEACGCNVEIMGATSDDVECEVEAVIEFWHPTRTAHFGDA
jgi:hypothetical protein